VNCCLGQIQKDSLTLDMLVWGIRLAEVPPAQSFRLGGISISKDPVLAD